MYKGASRGHLCDSTAFLYMSLNTKNPFEFLLSGWTVQRSQCGIFCGTLRVRVCVCVQLQCPLQVCRNIGLHVYRMRICSALHRPNDVILK